jgi:hypothetical protein
MTLDPPDKTDLSPSRLLDVLAVVHLALGSPAPWAASGAGTMKGLAR